MERWYLLITEKFCFELFGDGKYSLFLRQEVDGKSGIYWLLKSSCLELFGDGKNLFFSQKFDGKIVFTWSFWAFHDIPGLEIRFFVQWHHRNFQVVATEMFQVKNEMSPETICDISPKRINNHHNLGHTNHFESHFVRTV